MTETSPNPNLPEKQNFLDTIEVNKPIPISEILNPFFDQIKMSPLHRFYYNGIVEHVFLVKKEESENLRFGFFPPITVEEVIQREITDYGGVVTNFRVEEGGESSLLNANLTKNVWYLTDKKKVEIKLSEFISDKQLLQSGFAVESNDETKGCDDSEFVNLIRIASKNLTQSLFGLDLSSWLSKVRQGQGNCLENTILLSLIYTVFSDKSIQDLRPVGYFGKNFMQKKTIGDQIMGSSEFVQHYGVAYTRVNSPELYLLPGGGGQISISRLKKEPELQQNKFWKQWMLMVKATQKIFPQHTDHFIQELKKLKQDRAQD